MMSFVRSFGRFNLVNIDKCPFSCLLLLYTSALLDIKMELPIGNRKWISRVRNRPRIAPPPYIHFPI